MTDEQIKQSAEEWVKPLIWEEDGGYNENDVPLSLIKNAFIAGAHSRDEEIEELKKLLFEKECDIQFLEHKLRNPWIGVEERLPGEGQDVLICNWMGRITRIENVGAGDINYMKDNPELYASWMLVQKPELKKGE